MTWAHARVTGSAKSKPTCTAKRSSAGSWRCAPCVGPSVMVNVPKSFRHRPYPAWLAPTCSLAGTTAIEERQPMAVLQQPVSHSNPFAQVIGDSLAPAGTFIATVLDVKDEFGVTRQKFQSTETEKVDLTCFLFGFRDAARQPASGRQPSDAYQRQREVGPVRLPEVDAGPGTGDGVGLLHAERPQVPADGRARPTARWQRRVRGHRGVVARAGGDDARLRPHRLRLRPLRRLQRPAPAQIPAPPHPAAPDHHSPGR